MTLLRGQEEKAENPIRCESHRMILTLAFGQLEVQQLTLAFGQLELQQLTTIMPRKLQGGKVESMTH